MEADATAPPARWRIRASNPGDLADVLCLYDGAVAWLNARGVTGQWGTTPVSARPHVVAEVRGSLDHGFVAEDGAPVGFIALEMGTPGDIAPLLTAKEVAGGAYVHSLVARRTPDVRGVGAALLRRAAAHARAGGKSWLRLSCWDDNPKLVAYYEGRGFARRGVTGADGQVLLEKRLGGVGEHKARFP